MKAKSEALRDAATGKKPDSKVRPQAGRKRLPHAERKAQILKTATEFFADNGLTAQTRRLADECGISQRLLYRFFPTKEDLLDEVYRQEILGVFKPTWFVDLQDRSKPAEQRIILFYEDYLKVTLTRKWLRLLMYASLSDASMAPDYISAIVTKLMEVIVREVADERKVNLPNDRAALHEMGWTLHGAISHYAIRRHLYKASNILPEHKVIAMHVSTFMVGFESMVQDYVDHLD